VQECRLVGAIIASSGADVDKIRLMSEFRLIEYDEKFQVTEVPTNGRESLDWSWLGESDDLLQFLNKLLYGGWDKQANLAPNRITVRQSGYSMAKASAPPPA